MKQQILISALILLSMAGFARADNLTGFGFYGLSEDDFAAYKEGELIVCFADVDAGAQLPEGPVIMGPLTYRAIRDTISNFILSGAVVDRECGEIAPGLVVVKLPKGMTVKEAFIRFNQSANVLYAEPNYRYKLLAVPNDPMFSDLWGFDNTGQTGGTEDADVDAPEAWDIQTGDPEIIIAVTDSGIDYQHPDLADNMWVNTAELNGSPDVDDDNNGYIDDIYGYDFAGALARDPGDGDGDPIDCSYHGTHVAGIIGAVGNNGEGVVGVCWDVKLMALKVTADDYYREPDVFVSDVVKAIGYAVDNGAKVINASWGANFYSQSLYDAIKDAGDAGLLFVAAAGNDYGSDNDVNPIYPASFDLDNIISVMSTDHDDQRSDFSNYGATSVDVAEPGSEILSTSPTFQNFAMLVFNVATDYETLSGTSMAAPHVSGACALIWAEYPTLAHQTVKGILLKTVDPVLSSPRLCLSGGRINLYNALTLIPSGKAGKVLNSKDDPSDPTNLYSTIQTAIDDANDGDVLIAEANALFLEVIDFKGKAITLRSGDISNPNDPNISPEDTIILGILDEDSVVTFQSSEGPDTVLKGFTISWGNAEYGGGIRCDGASPRITDCIISNNFAKYYGGGVDCFDASPTIKNCTITENQTSSNSGIGGGINCERSSPVIENCLISYNFSNNVGGGIACHYADPTIFNCIIANNSAIYKSGGIDLEYSSPTITNCTIIVDDPNAAKDGGIFALHDSSPVIANCILWGNGDDLYNCSATYSCIEDDDSGMGNIHSEPLFMTGPLGDYYLRQTAAGQLSDSPCVDAGDPGTNIGDTYTTRTDGVADAGVVDIGAHYPALPANLVQLDVTVVDANVPVDPNLASGYVEPGSGVYRQYEVVQLRAYPDAGYRIKAWTGTDDDSSTEPDNAVTLMADASVTIEFEKIPLYQLRTEVIGGRGAILPYHRRSEYYPDGTVVTLVATPDITYIVDRWAGTDDDTSSSNTNTVMMDSDKEVTVLFRQPKSLHVPGQYQNIQPAIDASYDHGDKIIVSAGTYFGGYDFMGKAITIASEHPDDPCCVANTIIEIGTGPAFIFQSGEGPSAVVDGFTIKGRGDLGPIAPPDTEGTGADGDPIMYGLGGAIRCLNGSSPTLSHLVIRDCVARGQDGEDATFIFDPPADPDPPLDPLDPLDPLPEPNVPDPNDPNMWYPEDPNGPELPEDPNAPVDGFADQAGADGLPGEPGADGLDGELGYTGGNAGGGYGGAMYFDANSAPTILYCTIINCQAIGGDGGFGGLGQDGQNAQDGQEGQEGQEGQVGGEGLNDGEQGAGGNGGVGGDGGPGGNGGRGGDGGKGGDGGEALGGAIYFGPDCRPTIRYCKILGSSTRQGMGNYGGDAGSGGIGGAGAASADGGDGGDGEPDGEDGGEGADSPGGNGGDGGDGASMGINGTRSWAGAIYYGENCEVEISDTIISYNAATTTVPTFAYAAGDGGNGGDGGDGEGDAVGGNGGSGGSGGDGGPGEDDPGIGGIGGVGGADGEDGEDGEDGGLIGSSYTSSFGGGSYYEPGCKVKLTDCTISYNTTKQIDGSGEDGGGEDYEYGCEVILNRCEFIGNSTGDNGSGGGQYFAESCSLEINDCEYMNNSTYLDGGGLFCLSDCSLDITNSRFNGNSALIFIDPENPVIDASSGGGVYGGGRLDLVDPNSSTFGKWYNGGTITISKSDFANNEAAFGGGLYWHGNGAEVSISESVFNDNSADHGGGMYWSYGTAEITGCGIIDNKARGRIDLDNGDSFSGGGGGILCWSSDAKIENCFISNNSAYDSGGGVYFGGDPCTPILRNCLVKGNSAILDGGGIVSYWLVTPTISNCTIVDNRAYDPHDSTNGRGGGLSCSYESQTTLIDSILWGNTGSNGNQIAIGSHKAPFYIDRPATLTVSYCDIQGGRTAEAIYVEPGRILNWLDGNINANPLFVGSDYYLSYAEAGQAVDSPCVDAGSDLAVALGLDRFTTRSDGVADAGQVDMGLHYPIDKGQYRLIVSVIGEHGTVEPSSGFYNKFAVVTLTATVDTGYRVRWVGTNDDLSSALTNTVTMYSDRTVTVIMEQPTTIKVPGDYLSIQEALDAASDGDVIIVNKGRYRSAGIDIQGKAITITSTNPDDPVSVAETIIDCEGYVNSGVRFSSDSGPDTVLNGLTIANANWYAIDQEVPADAGADGIVGGNVQGGAILIESGASPTIINCIITDCLITAGNASSGNVGSVQGDLSDPDDPNSQPLGFGGKGGDGGDGGSAYGGGIYCGSYSSPAIINCTISNCQIEGAAAGDGADGGNGADNGVAGSGGSGGNGGGAFGGGIYIGYGSIPTIKDCNIVGCSAIGGDAGNAGNGGNTGGDFGVGGNGGIGGNNGQAYGGGIYFDGKNIATVSDCEIIGCSATAGNAGDGGNFGDAETAGTGRIGGGFLGEYWRYSACGGGVYCGSSSKVIFENCTVSNNSIAGGMSGVGGTNPADPDVGVSALEEQPITSYLIPSYGAGVFCEADSLLVFRGCDITGNFAQDVNDPNDPALPAYRLSPYISFGGGICSIDVDSALISDCNFTDNFATLGGGLYWDQTETVVTDSNFVENSAFNGGGIYCIESPASTIRGCDFTRNQATAPGGEGGAIYCSSIPIDITDCQIQHNIAYASGGGVYLAGGASEPRILANCLITDNLAGRDGGGVSANWYADPVISNCTFVRNAAAGTFGEPNNTGFGGGFYCSYESSSFVTDSIFWNNYALKGHQFGVGSGFEADQRCATLVVSYSDVKASPNDVWIDDNCTLKWGDGNIDEDPLFITGPFGDYYLSQTASGQSRNSSCLDAGSDYAGHIGLIGYTTRTDEVADTGMVDMGYHYPMAEPCRFCDLIFDGVINFQDFAVLADRWLNEDCSEINIWCEGADITLDRRVDFKDIAFLADCWLVEDTSPPVPDPSRWETEPYLRTGTSVSMTAETASDAWGWDVEYYFECIYGNCHDSGWQTSPTYTNTGLATSAEYGYRVKARDGVGNETEWSPVRYVSGIDNTPPAPAPIWLLEPYAVSENSVSMVATTAYDDNGVEYYFENTSGNGHDSGWLDDPNYTDSDLDPNTEYSYRVKARDNSPAQNETGWSKTVSVITSVPPDLIAPDPDPMEWDLTVDANGFDGTPREIWIDLDGDGFIGSFEFGATMTAVEAVDAGGGPVEYFFECTTPNGSDFSSGWLTFPAGQVPTYTVQLGRSGQGHRFRVKARDMYRNETTWSTEERAD